MTAPDGSSGRPTKKSPRFTPSLGWVEHNPNEIFDSVMETVEELLEATEISPRQLIAIGIANQRETTIVWERSTGRPVSNAIVWQCRRTAPLCDALMARGLEEDVAEKTGLPIDAYFPATKIRWILDHIPTGSSAPKTANSHSALSILGCSGISLTARSTPLT